tara:strand:+ start:742 stop:1245 length:504 start_codon:yes stop_codon:yes gene_type:complete
LNILINILTYSRILLTPLIIYLIFNNNFYLAGILFGYCSISDIADGRIARKFKLVSEHGNYMDPLADKILMIGALTALLMIKIIPFWAFLVICGRDIVITVYRNYLLAKNKPLQTSLYGKFKTVFQHIMVLIILLANPSQFVVEIIITVNAIYAASTGIHYFVKNGF